MRYVKPIRGYIPFILFLKPVFLEKVEEAGFLSIG